MSLFHGLFALSVSLSFSVSAQNDAGSYKWGISLNGTVSNISKLRRSSAALLSSVLECVRWDMDEDEIARLTAVSFGLLAVMLCLAIIDHV